MRGCKRWLSRVALATVPGLLCVSSLAACSAVLGIGDRTLDPELGEAGPSPEGATTMTMESSVDAAAPVVLAMGLNHPFSLAVDANNAYWTEYGSDQGTADGYVKSCALSGCPSGPTVVAAALTNPRGIAVDANNIYFGTATYGATVGAILSCPLAGCSGAKPTQLSTADIPYGVTVDDAYVYWVDFDDNSVHRVAKTGGSATVLVSANSSPLSEGEFIAVDATNVYVSDAAQNVFRLPLGGGTPVQMVTGQVESACPLAVDSTSLYYVASTQIMRTNKATTAAGKAIATGIQQVVDLTIDPTTSELYWADYGSAAVNDGTLGKVATSGSGQTLIASALAPPEAVRISGSYLVWLSNGQTTGDAASGPTNSTGTLNRQPK